MDVSFSNSRCCVCYSPLIPQSEFALGYCFNEVPSLAGNVCHLRTSFKTPEKSTEAVKLRSHTQLQHVIGAPRCHIDSWRYNNLLGRARLSSHSSLNGNKADEIMTQRSTNISPSYFCKDKNDLIKCCLCFNLFIYSLSCTFGCGTKLCWLWKHQTVPKFIPDSASRPSEDAEHGSSKRRRSDTSSLQERLNQTLILRPSFTRLTSQSESSDVPGSVFYSFVNNPTVVVQRNCSLCVTDLKKMEAMLNR